MTVLDNDRLRYQAALDALKRGQPMEALKALDTLESQTMDDPEYWRLRGVCVHRSGQTETAERHLRHAIELDRFHEASWITLAGYYEECKRDREALATYRDALAVNPESARINLAMGHFYQFQAAGIGASSVGIDPQRQLLRGTADDHERTAVVFLEKAYDQKQHLDTKNQSWLLGVLSLFYCSHGDMKKALAFLKEARCVEPNSHIVALIESEMRMEHSGTH